MNLKALKDLVAAMFECELLKHAEGGILARPGGEGGPTIDAQVDEDSYQLQISAFFLFSNFRKRQIALYSPCRLVGRLTSPLIFFSIYRGIKALYQPNST